MFIYFTNKRELCTTTEGEAFVVAETVSSGWRVNKLQCIIFNSLGTQIGKADLFV